MSEDIERVVQRVTAFELKQDIIRFDGHLRRQDDEITALREAQARLEGKVDVLIGSYERAATAAAANAALEIEVRKTGQLSAIHEHERDASHRRRVALRLVTGFVGLWAIIATALMAKC